MMSEPLISILIPVKNAALYLTDCIGSIIEQSEPNWELIAIDDHSTDNSYDILKAYEQQDTRIKVLKNNGQGIIPALRKAYHNSKGSLITRMDADDIMIATKLKKLKTLLLESGKGHLVTGLVEYFSNEQLGDGYLKYQNWLNNLSLKGNNYLDIYKECVIASPCWMIFRDDLEKCDAFNPDIYPEDYDLCFRFYQNNLKIKTVPQVLHQWRDYQERTSRNDPNYADVHFFDLKIKYFLSIDYNSEKSLILWGAGKKGKKLAKILQSNSIVFHWVTDNPQKINHDIYGIKLQASKFIGQVLNPQIILSIASPDDLIQVGNILSKSGLQKGCDYFHFC